MLVHILRITMEFEKTKYFQRPLLLLAVNFPDTDIRHTFRRSKCVFEHLPMISHHAQKLVNGRCSIGPAPLLHFC